MAWRDDIVDRVCSCDVDGVLRIFDELWADRERVRTLNAAYLHEIAILKGTPSRRLTTPDEERVRDGQCDALFSPFKDLTVALRQFTAWL